MFKAVPRVSGDEPAMNGDPCSVVVERMGLAVAGRSAL